jgi:hypothetical protein
MGKIDELSEEIIKYTNIYNDILVGMHADINSYKKKVVIQTSKTTKAINLINSNIEDVIKIKSDADDMLLKVNALHSKTLVAKESLDNGLTEFKKESKIILTKLNHLEKNLTQIKEEITNKIKSNHKELDFEILQLKKINKNFKIVVIVIFLILLTSISFLYYKTL